MAKHKNRLIAAGIIIVILAALFWWGGNAPGLQGWSVGDKTQTARQLERQTVAAKELPASLPADVWSKPVVALAEQPATSPENEEEPAVETPEKPNADECSGGMEINPETGKDKYNTDPVPEGKPLPVEPQEAVIGEAAYTCTISISCATILDNPDWLNPEKTELVPEGGVILPAQTVTFYEGESVFNVLQRTCKQNSIHMEFSNTPMYNSAYIEGIHNLYEFDCGEGSGWMYKVNGWFPNYGCSRYQLQNGDVIEWVYTCNRGDDVGGGQVVGG